MTMSVPAVSFDTHQKEGHEFMSPAPAEKMVSFPYREAECSQHYCKHFQRLAHTSNDWYHNIVANLPFSNQIMIYLLEEKVHNIQPCKIPPRPVNYSHPFQVYWSKCSQHLVEANLPFP